MKWLMPLVLLSVVYADESEQGLFIDNDRPQNFPVEQNAIEDNTILIPNARGIMLLGDETRISHSILTHVEGVRAVGIEVPGGVRQLEDRLSPLFKNKSLTRDDIINIKKEVIRYYQSEHHPLVTVSVPEQEVTNGVLQLVVSESRLEKVEAYGAKWFSNQKLAKQIKLKKGEPINEEQLVKDLQWINKNPFHQSDAIYSPGKEPNTTVVELVTKDRFPLRVYTGSDNTGLDSIGKDRYFAGFTWGNAFWADQQLSYQYTSAYDHKRFYSHTAHYEVPLPWRHTFLAYGGYSSAHPRLSDFTNSTSSVTPGHFTSHGMSVQASGRYTVPLNPIGTILQEITGGFDFKRTNTTVFFTETPIIGKLANLTQFMLGYSLGAETRRTKTSFEIDFFYSPCAMVSDQSRSDFASLRPGARPTYFYGRVLLEETFRLPRNWSIDINFRGQFATKPLLPSEQFGIGGYDTVRGYEERIYQADEALYGSLEVRTPVCKLFWQGKKKVDNLQLLAFFDYGFGYNLRRPPGEKRRDYLMSAGPGLRYTISHYFSTRVDWGIKLHDIAHDRPWSRVHWSAILSY